MGRRNSRDERDSKYVRLTGLWASKRDGLWTGRMRPEDIENLQRLLEEANKADAPLTVFLWENDRKRSKRDADFTIQACVADDDDQSSRGRERGRDDDKNDDRETRQDRTDDKSSRRDNGADKNRNERSQKPKKDDW